LIAHLYPVAASIEAAAVAALVLIELGGGGKDVASVAVRPQSLAVIDAQQRQCLPGAGRRYHD
jgi:hypothetical protein